jgi:hypothetical protein
LETFSDSSPLYQTLITTGIAFNVIIVRATPRREQQLTQYDVGTILSESNPTTGSTTFDSLTFTPNHDSKVERDFDPATVAAHYDAEKLSSRRN